MQKWLIFWLGALLSSCLSAAAQTPTAQVVLIRTPSAPPLVFARVMPAQLPPAPVPLAQPAGKIPVGLTALLARAESLNQGLRRFLSVEVVKTTFATESRIPIVQLAGGRLQLDGFESTQRLGNVLFGPSGSGHPHMRVPRPAWAYGISLSFRLGRDATTERRADGWRRLAWMVGAGGDRRP